ncbi:serpin family protein [Glycomyces harbinensis]|uniref:Serine protease inhibitor n=1 Tax=Glycomyces harbinensis TaxID=58114 RepID=A0A1G7AHR2_9ACTN|nr:serpin family protein [Glycomyces harbinensis]SDE14302.1 Serine protease inhibitor [Glycomyces harbinensis]
MGTSEGTFQQALTAADVDAANDLTRRWLAARAEVPAAASGLGVWPLLAVLATGAAAATRDELLAAAALDADRAATVPASLLAAARDAPAISLALAVWAGERVTLDPEWVAGLPVDAVGSLTGDPAADKAALDAWASRNTQGLIERMPLDFTQPIDLVLASALAVRTTWTTPFADHSRAFATGPWSGLGRCRTLNAVLHDDVLRVADHASVLTVRGDGDIDVLLGLGRDDLPPHAVMDALLDANDPAWGRSATELSIGDRAVGVQVAQYMGTRPQAGPEIDVQAVRFKLDADLDLSEDAAALGLELAADEQRARFDRLAAEPVYVSQARQTCTAEFSATGFEAAAVTAIAMARAAGLPKRDHRRVKTSVAFDRPFAYLARHRPTGLVLVAGWVAEPERV